MTNLNTSTETLTPEQQAKDLLSQAQDLIIQAEILADEHGFTLSWGLAYGMGGIYYPKGCKYSWMDEWEIKEYEEDGQWKSSSSQC